MSAGWWASRADIVLSEIFVVGEPAPDRAALRDAYPFGERAMWPYKAWLARVKAWKCAHAAGLATPNALPKRQFAARHQQVHDDDGATLDLFGGAA